VRRQVRQGEAVDRIVDAGEKFARPDDHPAGALEHRLGKHRGDGGTAARMLGRPVKLVFSAEDETRLTALIAALLSR